MSAGARLYLAFVALVLVAPLVVLAGISVNESKSLYFPPQGFSLGWFGELLFEPGWRRALTNSLIVAAGSALVALAIALPLAYAIWRFRPKGGETLYIIGLMPFILPPVVSALGFLAVWASIGLYGQLVTAVFSHGVFLTTLPLVTITLGLRAIPGEIVEAAGTMGAGEWTLARTIVLPLIVPYMISGVAFAFVLSLNEYIIAFMTIGFSYETLPVKIFNSLRYGYSPTMAAAASVFVGLAVLVFGLIAWFGDLPRLLGATTQRDSP
ncbi:MAG: ABC transporter permease [Geminicoccaceae bacterium]